MLSESLEDRRKFGHYLPKCPSITLVFPTLPEAIGKKEPKTQT